MSYSFHTPLLGQEQDQLDQIEQDHLELSPVLVA